MTLQGIAKIAGVSVSTVSKAFSDSDEISKTTKALIFEAARQNGCFEKYYKGKYKKKIIAVICPEIIGDYYNGIVTELEKIINDMGAVMLVSVTNFDLLREKELFEYYSFVQKVDGIIIIDNLKKIDFTVKTPLVAVGGADNMISVNIDNALDDVIKHLKEIGHKHIAFAGEKLTERKAELFKTAVINNRLNFRKDFVFESVKRFEEAGCECAKKMIEKSDRPTAVICAYDNIAIGLMKELKKFGIDVPKDISVIGINDIPSAAYGDVELASIRIDVHDLCEVAMEMLKKKLDNQYMFSGKEISVEGRFIKRSSVKTISEYI